MIRRLALAAVLVMLPACSRPGPRHAPPALTGPPRVAVMPFRTARAPGAETEPVPADAGLAAARMLGAHLAALGIAVVDADRVLGTWSLSDTHVYDASLAAHVGERVGANVAAFGVLSRYHERQGSAWAVESPAAVAYEAALVHVPDGTLIAVDRFEYAQQALSQNLLELPRFVEGGGRWLTREELLDQSLAHTAERLGRALGVAPGRR